MKEFHSFPSFPSMASGEGSLVDVSDEGMRAALQTLTTAQDQFRYDVEVFIDEVNRRVETLLDRISDLELTCSRLHKGKPSSRRAQTGPGDPLQQCIALSHTGDYDAAFRMALDSGDSDVLERLLSHTGPVMESLEEDTVSSVYPYLMRMLERGSCVSTVLFCVQQLFDFGIPIPEQHKVETLDLVDGLVHAGGNDADLAQEIYDLIVSS